MVEASLNKNTNRDTSEYNVTVIIYSICRCSGDGYLRLSHKEETVVRIHPPAQERDKDGRILGVSPGGCYGGHAALRHQIVQCHPRVNK